MNDPAAMRDTLAALGNTGIEVFDVEISQYMSDAFQNELKFLGIRSSPAFVRAPQGNGCAERLTRTLKGNLLWVRTFDIVEQLRQALLEFRRTYNSTWLIERHSFRTPDAVRQDQFSTAAMIALASTRCLSNRGRTKGCSMARAAV